MADGAISNDGHGDVPSNCGQDNNVQERQSSTNRSTRAVRVRRRRRGRGHRTNARNLVNPITNAHAQAGVGIVAGPSNVGGARRALHAAVVANVGGVAIVPAPFGNPVAGIQAGVRIIVNAGGAGAIGPLVGAQVGGVAPAAPAIAQQNLVGVAAMVAPFGPVQPNFDIDDGLLGPPLRRSEVGPFFRFL